jgi:hypothetical protein
MNHFNRLISRNNWIVLVLLKKQAIMNENKCFVCKLLFFENMTIISFFVCNNSLLLHNLMNFSEKNRYCDEYWWNDLLREYVENMFCVLFRCEMWFEKYDTNFFMQRLFVTIRSRDFVWSFHRQCFDFLVSIQRVTYVRFRFVKRRMCSWWDDSNDCISSNWKRFIIWKRFRSDSDNRISLNCERFIKSDESNSSSLMRITRECWWNKISSNLWKIEKSHQTWRICFCFSNKKLRETIFDVEKT